MSMNVADSEVRPALGLASNKSNKSVEPSPKGKPISKPLRKVEVSPQNAGVGLGKEKKSGGICSNSSSVTPSARVSSILCRQAQFNSLSLNASCSSDASSDSFRSRGSTGRISRTSSLGSRRKLSKSRSSVSCDGVFPEPCGGDSDGDKKRCAWVTPNADPLYATFHDVEWGVPEHDDKKLFELLVLSGALAELTWPVILSKRPIFREVFLDFDPVQVVKLSEKKILASGSTACSLLSELKLRSIVENARQIFKVIEEFGSFDKYIWSFVNHKPIVSRFRYPRQVPVKTPKADVISKDLVRRGFRSVSPTVIYSFMQAAGLTNDHLVSCFRFHDCLSIGENKEENGLTGDSNNKKPNVVMETTDITRAIDELSLCSEL